MSVGIVLGTVAVLIGVVQYGLYSYKIYLGEVKPHAFTWLIWAILTTIAAVAQFVDDAGPGAWVMAFTALMSYAYIVVGLGASSRAYITRVDWYFFFATLAAIPLWLITDNPLWSVILITIIDAVAYAPMFRKAYYNPETESALAQGLASSKFIFGILALQSLTLVTVLYPASLIVMNGAFALMLLWRRKFRQ
jgi:hypothetical protein